MSETSHGNSAGTPGRVVTRIGVISDTHGILRPEAIAALSSVDRILHAGDIGRPDVLERLRLLAPVTAVRGNVDGEWASGLPETDLIEIDGVVIFLVHDLDRIDVRPAAAGVRVVVSGHTHRPAIREKAGVLYVNPGSASAQRSGLPATLAVLYVRAGERRARLVNLEA
jgi:putative phosphoesterase